MDNVTHTLIGITFAKVLAPRPDKTLVRRERAIFWTSVLGSNLPDADSLLAFFRRSVDGNLNYLLEHRGYTHTAIGALPMGMIAALVGCLISKTKPSKWLFFVGVISVLLHIGADALNDYGVHPFSPFMNRWYYGDSVFILEPFLWVTMLPFAISTIRWKPGRVIWTSLGVGLMGLIWFGPFLSFFWALLVTLWALLFTGLQRLQKGVAPVVAGIFLVLFGFSYSSHLVQVKLTDHFRKSPVSQSEHLQDLITTPSPGNPFCWNCWLVTHSQDEYISRNTVVSLWPRVADPASCFPLRGNHRTAPFSQTNLESGPSILWLGEYRLSRAIFRKWSQENSCFRSFLAFSRLPYLAQVDGRWIAGDLRYDRGEGKSFAQIELEGANGCAAFPKWEPPFQR